MIDGWICNVVLRNLYLDAEIHIGLAHKKILKDLVLTLASHLPHR